MENTDLERAGDAPVAVVEADERERGEGRDEARGQTLEQIHPNPDPEYYDRREQQGSGGGGARGRGRGRGRGDGGRGRGRGWHASSLPHYVGALRRGEPYADRSYSYYPVVARSPPTQNVARSSVQFKFCFKCAQTGHVTRDCKFYKTRFCSYFTNTGDCQYNHDSRLCVYAHGHGELRLSVEKYCVRIVYENGEQMIFGCGAAGHSIDQCPALYGAAPSSPALVVV